MGLFSSKKSTSTTLATTNNTGFSELSDEAVAISGSGNTVNRLDGGAIASALDFASASSRDSLDFASASSRDSFDFASASSRDSFDFAKDALKDSMGIAGETIRDSAALTANVAAKAVADESDKLAEIFKLAIGAAAVIAATMMLRKGRA